MNTGLIVLYQNEMDLRLEKKFPCYKCKTEIIRGVPHRTTSSRNRRYCSSCVGFFLSRYEGVDTFLIAEPSTIEIVAKKFWDAEWVQHVEEVRLTTLRKDGQFTGFPTPFPQAVRTSHTI